MRQHYLLFTAICLCLLASCTKTGEPDNVIEVPSPGLWIANHLDHNLSVVTNDSLVVNTIALGDAPYPNHLAISPDGSMIAVSTTGSNFDSLHANGHQHCVAGNYQIVIINTANGGLIKSITTDCIPYNAQFNTDGSELWYALHDENGRVIVLETTNWAQTHYIPVSLGPLELQFSTDGTQVWVANQESNTVSVIDADTKQVIAIVPVGSHPTGAWPANNGFVYVACEWGQQIKEIDAVTHFETFSIDVLFRPTWVSHLASRDELWVSDPANGRVVWFIRSDNEWVIYGAIPTGLGTHQILFSPDGATAYVSNTQAGTVSVIDTYTHSKQRDILVGNSPKGIFYKS